MPVGGCVKIGYSGAEESCLIVSSAQAKTLTARTGAAGLEAPDPAFGPLGSIDLTSAEADTLGDLVGLIEGLDDYSASLVYGDDIPTAEVLSASAQAKGADAYVLFSLASVLGPYALTSWARTKLYLGLPDSDQTLVEYLVNTASEIAENLAQRRLGARSYTADLDGSGAQTLLLPDYPVASIAHLSVDSLRLFGAGTELDPTDYVLYAERGIVARADGLFPKGRQNVRVEYEAGMASVDSRLQDAVIEVVAWNLRRFRGSGIGIRSISAPDGVNTSLELTVPLSARQVFESYRDARL